VLFVKIGGETKGKSFNCFRIYVDSFEELYETIE